MNILLILNVLWLLLNVQTVYLLLYSTNDDAIVVGVDDRLMTTLLYVNILTTLIMTGVIIGLV